MDALRLAFVWPGGGAEQEYYQFAEATGDQIKIFLACSRVGGTGEGSDHDIEALLETARIDWITDAAKRSVCLRPDTVFWACTSGSFVVGRRGAEEQINALQEATGVPAGSTSLAFAAAITQLGFRRVGVLAPYPEPTARAFVAFLKEFDIEVACLDWLDAPSGWDSAAMDGEMIIERVVQVSQMSADAILVPDTALPTLSLVEEMERRTGQPVLTANAVTLWQAIRLAGGNTSYAGYGSLLGGQ